MNVVLLFFLLVSLPFASHAADAKKTTALQFALNWKAESEFGGFYAAKLAGSFEKRGLNVEITEGGAGTPVVQMVANSKVPFGIAAADEVVLSQARGTDVIALLAVYQTNPQGVMVHAERGFKSLADVFAAPGTLAIQSGAPYALYLQAQFAHAKVKLVPYAGGIAQFLTDANYSQQCFVTSEPLLAKKKNKPVASFLISDAGFNPYGTVVIARRQYIDKNPQRVRDMIEAIRDGWSDYLRAPERTNTLMVKLNPAMDNQTMRESADVQKPFILGANTPNTELGKMTGERWMTLVNQLSDLKLITKKPVAANRFKIF